LVYLARYKSDDQDGAEWVYCATSMNITSLLCIQGGEEWQVVNEGGQSPRPYRASLHLLLLDADDLNRTKEGLPHHIYVAALRHLLSHEAKKEGGPFLLEGLDANLTAMDTCGLSHYPLVPFTSLELQRGFHYQFSCRIA
jgi:hypothetical protein